MYFYQFDPECLLFSYVLLLMIHKKGESAPVLLLKKRIEF